MKEYIYTHTYASTEKKYNDMQRIPLFHSNKYGHPYTHPIFAYIHRQGPDLVAELVIMRIKGL